MNCTSRLLAIVLMLVWHIKKIVGQFAILKVKTSPWLTALDMAPCCPGITELNMFPVSTMGMKCNS
jgi:hypothetical protein